MKIKYDENLYMIPPNDIIKQGKQAIFYWKVKNDRKWYIESFLKIRNKDAKLVPFRFNKAQDFIYKKYLECIENDEPPRFIVLKSRQQGISTWTEGMVFTDTATDSYKNSFIVAHEQAASSNLFNMSKLFYDELPEVIKPMKSKSNEKALIFENPTRDDGNKAEDPGLRSKFTVSTANTREAGRSGTYHNVHVSEVAFFVDAETTLISLVQAVPNNMNTLVVLESTANGVGDYFHRQWNLAKEGKTDFKPVFLPWSFDVDCVKQFKNDEIKKAFMKEVNKKIKDSKGEIKHTYEYNLMKEHDLTYEQLYWRSWAIMNKCGGNEKLFAQEYPINDIEAFISTGRGVFNSDTLKLYSNQCKPGVIGYLNTINSVIDFEKNDDGYLEIWKLPDKEDNYSIGADVAEGLITGDYSHAYVLDSNYDLVAAWHGHIDPDIFGFELVKLARYYNEAYLGVENNNHGLTTLKAIQNLEYHNIYYTKTVDKITDKITQKMGWSTNMKSKHLMIDVLNQYVRDKALGIKDRALIDEMFTYVFDEKGSANAQVGCHDDRVMACAIALQVATEGRGISYDTERTDKRKSDTLFNDIDADDKGNVEEVSD